MAKRKRNIATPTESRAKAIAPPAPDDVLMNFAEDLGRVLGTAQAKATAWMDQRKAVQAQLTQIRDTATQYLTQLGHDVAAVSGLASGLATRRGRPPGSQNQPRRGPGRPKGSGAVAEGKRKRTMSPEARAKIAAAQRLRWAKVKKAGA